MKQEIPPPSARLSMQTKLDQIAHDRDVLSLLRALAALGLREGDRLRHVDTGEIGRLNVAREDDRPRAVVVLSSGSRATFDTTRWLPTDTASNSAPPFAERALGSAT